MSDHRAVSTAVRVISLLPFRKTEIAIHVIRIVFLGDYKLVVIDISVFWLTHIDVTIDTPETVGLDLFGEVFDRAQTVFVGFDSAGVRDSSRTLRIMLF
jgi:hypothetical protein